MDNESRRLSPTQLFERGCASLDLASQVLVSVGTALSASATHIHHGIVLRRRKKSRKRINIAKTTPQPPPNATQLPPKKAKHVPGPTVSPFFLQSPKKSQTKVSAPTVSPFFREPFSRIPEPRGLNFKLQETRYGLIQERICESLFALVIQTILWNKTKGAAARPVLWNLLCRYPTPGSLAAADPVTVQDVIRVLGLQERRALCLVKMATAWVAAPPCPERRYGRRNYPRLGKKGRNDVKERELLGPDDGREGWEIGHLPGVGEYALDSYRIFGRDRLRGLHGKQDVEPEWKRVIPADKELGPYVRWKWAQEGWDYDLATGVRTRA